jgi:AcrR family transcriptional regulator
MGDIATLAGIAKGTLYNHFRTKEAVFSASLEAGIAALADECELAAHDDLADALSLAAERIAGHGALRRVVADEPAAHAALVTRSDSPIWQQARDGVAATLAAAGRAPAPASVELVLRWLVSFVSTPGADPAAQAALLATALPAS